MDSQQPDQAKQYRLAIRRPVTMAMLFLTLIVFGWRSYQQLPINLMPDISYPTLTVRTEYEGAAPADVEKLVTRPLEEMLSIVGGLVEISSISSPGLSEIILEFTWGTDMSLAQQDVRDRLDLFEPPRELTKKPVILRYDPTLDPVMRVAISPDPNLREALRGNQEAERLALTRIRDAAERYLKSDLEAEGGVAQVLVQGGQEAEIQVLVDSRRLKGLGLSLDYVVNKLAQQNINLSGGRLKEGDTEYLVRTLNEFQAVEEIGQSIVTTPEGGRILLRDVADVFLGTKERETIVHRNGIEAVQLEIYKEGGANTVEVSNRVRDLLGFDRDLGLGERISLMAEARVAEMRGMLPEADSPESERDLLALRENLLDRLPENVELAVISDQARFIVGAIDEVKDAVITGGLLALAVLFLFLRDLKTTAIIGLAIPISVVAAFVPMFIQGISLNIMSLGGLALGVGMLVDNSIVVLESIFRCREEGDGVLDAAERGTQEVGSAVIASTLTTVSVFLPIAFVQGVAGQLFNDLALTVSYSLLASLLTALFLIPLVASRKPLAMQAERQVLWVTRALQEGRSAGESWPRAFLRAFPRAAGYAMRHVRDSFAETVGPSIGAMAGMRRGGFGGVLKGIAALALLPLVFALWLLQVLLRFAVMLLATLFLLIAGAVLAVLWLTRLVLRALLWLPLYLFDKGFNLVRNGYGVLLRHSLRFSGILLLLAVGLAVHAGFTARGLGAELIPPMKQGEFGIRMEARAGTRLQETEQRAQRIETVVRQFDEVENVTVEIGQEGASSERERGENVAEFTVNLRDPDVTARYQDEIIDRMRGAIHQVSTDEITFTLPALFSFKTAVELQIIGDDLEQLRLLGQEALRRVAATPGVTDPELSMKQGYPELIVEMDAELLASRGLSSSQVAERLRTEVQGEVATRFSRAGERVDIRVRTDQRQLESKEDLYRISVSEGPAPIPLADVAEIREVEGPSEIRRIDQRQVVLVNANVEGRDLAAVAQDILAAVRTLPKPEGYYFVLGGQNRELETSYASLRFALLLAIFLVYVVMACQFESFWHPALVMGSAPLAFIGVIYALDWFEIDLSIMVFLGGIVLAGIVVNNAIVLVDYINQLRARGRTKFDAVIEAGQVRLRPILMTTVTTVLGLTPMILASGEGAELRRPMAITVMAGLSSATVLTLLLIPMAYYLFGGRDRT